METREKNVVNDSVFIQRWQWTRQVALRPSYLHLVTAHDLLDLGGSLARQQIPPDFSHKLAALAEDELGHRFIEQNCRTIIALLLAVEEGSFKEASRKDCERLLRVLAYVRKDDDAVPDYRSDGFVDDQLEMRAVTTELDPLLRAFKVWRLRHQVPGMWLNGQQFVRPETDFARSSASLTGEAKFQNGHQVCNTQLLE
jgi:hypothetical protein